jgi:hypothetical protein
MASAEQQLQDLIAGVRAEAKAEGYAEGYASAWGEIVGAARKALGGGGTPASSDLFGGGVFLPAISPTLEGGSLLREALIRARRPRGENRELVMGVLEMVGSKLGATEIQRALKSHGLAYSSVRNALSQLVEAGKAIEHPGGLFEAKTETSPTDKVGDVVG